MARRLTDDPTEAEDLIGQALMSASGAWATFDGRYPRSWLIQILTNCYRAWVRRRVSRPAPLRLEPEMVASEPWNAIDWELCAPYLLAELDRLAPEYRLAITLFDIEELSSEEAAAAMGVSVGTAKSRVHRGRRLLRTRLASLMDDRKQ